MAISNSLYSMTIGDKIPCRYTALTVGVVGTFTELGTCTADSIPVASSATPDGLFYFIHAGYDTKGRMKLIADRNIQNTISWDALNTNGIASGSGLPLDFGLGTSYETNIRLLTGGTSATDKDNEWDKIIVNSTLNNTITAGDNSFWNWNGVGSHTSSTGTTTTNIVVRGSTTVATTASATTSLSNTTTGFRPVLIFDILSIIKYLLKDGISLKSIDSGILTQRALITDNDSTKETAFINYGMDDLSEWTDSLKSQIVSGKFSILIYDGK